jgi:hypothetical protein
MVVREVLGVAVVTKTQVEGQGTHLLQAQVKVITESLLLLPQVVVVVLARLAVQMGLVMVGMEPHLLSLAPQ